MQSKITEVQVPVAEFNDSIHKWQLEVLRAFDQKKARFFLLNWHRRARKTTLDLNILIREAVVNKNRRYGYITSTYKAAKNIVWRDPNMLKRYLPMQFVKKFNESELFIEFTNGSILSIHGSDDPDSLRGVDYHGVVLDEWALIKPLVWEEIIRPIIAQDATRWCMMIFTPKGRNHAYTYWLTAKTNPDWARYELKGEDSLIITRDELDKLKADIPMRTYAQEIQCEFNEDASGVFRGIDGCVYGGLEEPQKGYSYVTGVDLAKTEDYTVITTICRENRNVVAFKRFNQLDWSIQKEAILGEVNKYRSHAVIDSTGIGDPICEDLIKAGINVTPYGFTAASKKELIDRLVVSIEQRLVTFPGIEVLIDELKSYTYELTPSRNVRYSAPEGMHDDCVISLGLAVWGCRNFLYGKKIVDRNRVRKINYANQQENAGMSFV